MQQLNLPSSDLTLRDKNGKTEILDIIRRKYVLFTAEEWVRQNFIRYLISRLEVPASLIAVEASLKYNRLRKRSDIVVYDRFRNPRMIVECKAPDVKITQEVFDQAALYNMTFNAPFLVVTNGLEHFACHIDHRNSSYSFLQEIPAYPTIVDDRFLYTRQP